MGLRAKSASPSVAEALAGPPGAEEERGPGCPCWGGPGGWVRWGSESAAKCAPGRLLQPVLSVFFKTKEVQKAMDEKRFDEAIQLRGR